MQLDHVILAAPVRGPDTPRLPSSYGLEPVPGGRHPAWGTANWIVPLGDSYLELIAVVDEHVAGGNDFGRRVLDASEGDLIGWAVRPDDIDATATRLGLTVGRGSRTRSSGERIEWRMAGLEDALERPWLPFFVAWRGVTRPRFPERLRRLLRTWRDSRSRATSTSCRPGSGRIRSRSTFEPGMGV